MNFEEARKSFPGLRDKVYLDAAAVSLIPVQSYEGIKDFLDLAVYGDAEDASSLHILMDNMRIEALEEAAKLLKTSTKNIALIESTTHGLNIAANSIPLKKGDNVLIAETEYLQVAIPWYKKKENIGIEIKKVLSQNNGVLTPEDFLDVVDNNTKVICVSSVQWCSGYRLDIKSLGEICKEKGIWLVVDAIQEIGAVDVDLSVQYADIIIAGGHKWLNAPFGCGIMFISDKVLNELEPDSYGYLALEPPEGGWGTYFRTPDITPFRDYNFPATAKKFEIAGTSNYPGTAGLAKSLKLFNEIGIKNVEKQIRNLTDLLYEELDKVNADIVSKREPEHRSGISVFRIYDSYKRDEILLKRILLDKIFISIRYTSGVGGIRISTHFYNNEEDIMKLISAVKRHTGKG
jgi:selenocysteine lyase/cysteine desulfurase